MPYRIDISHPADGTSDRLIELGALDVDVMPDGTLAAILPDSVDSDTLAKAVAGGPVVISSAVPRDEGSVWVLRSRPLTVGRLRFVPADSPSDEDGIRMIDSTAFGTGLHPTSALCLEAIERSLESRTPDTMLDVGTGSGVLALGALSLGVRRVTGIDLDPLALLTAKQNARLNGLEDRLDLVLAAPEALSGRWPLVVANVLAAPLIEMASPLVRLVGRYGELVLSGIPVAVREDVEQVYRSLGMRSEGARTRGGWVALSVRASW